MRDNKGKGGITQRTLVLTDINIIGNKMSDNLFHVFAHTPLALGEMHRSGHKIIVCLSRHDFKINGFELKASGLIARNKIKSAKNIEKILTQHLEVVVLVSQTAKKYFDKETSLQNYKSRIFCLLSAKKGITNKPSNTRWSKIRTISL